MLVENRRPVDICHVGASQRRPVSAVPLHGEAVHSHLTVGISWFAVDDWQASLVTDVARRKVVGGSGF